MDISAFRINVINTPSPRSTPFRSTNSPTGARARLMSPAYQEQCRLEGCCTQYGTHNHWVADCLLQPYKKQVNIETLRQQRLESESEMDEEICWLQRGEI